MAASFARLFALTALAAALLPARAQGEDRPAGGQFRFLSADLPSELQTCADVPIAIEDAASSGIGPFYMISSPVGGGTPQTTLIGAAADALSWTVAHPAGSRLVLNVVDSTGSGGGIPAALFEVVEGDSTACAAAADADADFVAWTNVEGALETCGELGIAFDGGRGPHTISISGLDAPTVTNITIEAAFSQYTYVNRAPGGSQLVITVSDSTGRWARGVPLVRTTGSVETDCAGAESSTGDWEALGYTRPTFPVADDAAANGTSTSTTASVGTNSSTRAPTSESGSAGAAATGAAAGDAGDASAEEEEDSGAGQGAVGALAAVAAAVVALVL